MKRITCLLAALLLTCGLTWAQTDVLNHDVIGVSGTSYSSWTDLTLTSGAVYAGNTAGGNNAIQMRSNNNNSGIVTTTSAGIVTNISVAWNENTSSSRALNVYGSNTAYSAASDLYGNNAGTLIGTIANGTTDLAITDEYAFIGIRSASGALYLDEIQITWSDGSGVTPPSITASNVEIAYDATEGAIEYTINNGVEGGVLSAETVAEWLTIGTVGETVPFTCTVNEDGAAREAVVTLTYTYGEQAINQAVTVTQAGNPNALDNISDITATGAYAVQGTIVAMSQRGFIVGDGTGYVYYYNTNYDQSAYAIGDMVKLAGNVVVYGGVFEFNNSTTVTPANSSNYVAEEPTVITGEEMDARVASTTPAQLSNYVQYEGTLSINNNHYNITNIAGATTAIGSISYPLDTEFASLNGQQVKVSGYYVGISSSTYYNTMIGTIEEVTTTDPIITITPATLNVDAEEHLVNYLDLAYENIDVENGSSFTVHYYNAEGEEIQLVPGESWMIAGVAKPNNDYQVLCVITANGGEARTAYFKVSAVDAENNTVYSNLVTVNQEAYVAPVPSITITPDVVNLDAGEHYVNLLDLAYENIEVEGPSSFTVHYYNAEGEEIELVQGEAWLIAGVVLEDDVYQVLYAVVANYGEARTAYFKVSCGETYSNLVTVTQAAPVLDYAVLPFVWAGGSSADFAALNGVTLSGNGSDYNSNHAPYLIKFDGTGDYIQVKTNGQPGLVTIGVKMIGGSNTSTITIQGSADGETFTDIEELTISGAQNDTLTLETTNAFDANDRYVRMLFTKGSNVGVGPITIAQGTAPSINIAPANFDLEAVGDLNGMQVASGFVTYNNIDITQDSDFHIQFYNAEGVEQNQPEWILGAAVSQIANSYQVACMVGPNTGAARSTYYKVYAFDADSNPVYSNLVTINQAGVPQPSITITPDVVNVDAALHAEQLPITYENIIVENFESFGVQFYDAEGEEAEMPTSWLVIGVTEEWENSGNFQVTCAIMANEGEARSAYFKVYAYTADSTLVYSNLVTINQEAYVAPALDYATLPFEFDGGRADIENTDGLTQEGLDSDYGSSPKLKFNTTGDWVLLHFNEEPGELAFDIKGNSFSGGTFTVQTSVDGETYEDLATYTELGSTEHETFNTLAADVRYIKWIYTEKVSGNVALGNITLAQPAAPVASITVDPAEVNATVEGGEGTLNVTYTNITEILAEVYFCDANGEAATYDWIVAEINAENNIDYLIDANDGEARTAYFKVYALDDETNLVYSNLVTINQAAPVVPPTLGEWVMVSLNDLTEDDVFVIVGVYDVDESSFAMPNNSTGAPSAVEVTIVGNTLSGDIDDNLQWNLSIGEDGYTFYPNGETETWLYCTNTNNGVRVGTNENNVFSMTSEGYLFNNATERYIGIYNYQDWRCYTSINNNIKEQTFAFYKRVDESEIETYTLDITGYGNSDGGYYLIASPVSMIRPTTDNGFLTEEYDLYYYDQTQQGEEWRNYEAKHFNIASGKGYLYASQENTTLTFTGIRYNGNGEVALDYVGDTTWNLIGNPYSYYATVNRDFYVLNAAGSELELSETSQVNPMQGIFVEAVEADETVSFVEESGGVVGEFMLNLRVSNGNGNGDFARIRFGEGRTLSKFMLNENNTKLYFTQGGNDYAVVRSEAEGVMPVNFKASENGTYTLSVNPENMEMEYLHLIDNMTGTDVDLLASPNYSFEANVSDNAARFTLVFASLTGIEENNTNNFAFFSNGSFIISNEGKATLQVIDVNGHILKSESINGCVNVNVNAAPGVYMLRLVNGDNVRVQKVVVR